MSQTVVAVPADIRQFEGYRWHATPEQYLRAALDGSGAVPLIVPALGMDIDVDAILERVDGVLISGSRSNVHPARYGEAETEAHAPFDMDRDATSLRLITRAIDKAVPLLAICRGIQELNVALGGTLFAEVHEIEGRIDHRKPEGEGPDEYFAIRQKVSVHPGSCLAAILGAGEVRVNSLHRQAIARLAPRLSVEAVADDGTVEAVTVADATGFAIGVQWHPEYWVGSDAPSDALFRAFGAAARAYRAQRASAIAEAAE